MKVFCVVEEVDVEDDNGREREGVMATCPRCGYSTESLGTGDGSVRRCLVLLREGCPEGENNYYVEHP